MHQLYVFFVAAAMASAMPYGDLHSMQWVEIEILDARASPTRDITQCFKLADYIYPQLVLTLDDQGVDERRYVHWQVRSFMMQIRFHITNCRFKS